MYISVNQLANAINNLQRINPEDVKADIGMNKYEICFVNNYGHIIKSIFNEFKTENQAIMLAKKEKFMYPECYIEILNLDTGKRIYA